MKLNRFLFLALGVLVVHPAFNLAVFAGDTPEQKAADLVEIKRLTEQIKLEPKRAFLYASRGQCYVGLEDWNKALVDTNKALELQPGNSSFLVALAAIYDGMHKYDLEESSLLKALQVKPDNMQGLKDLGSFYNVRKVNLPKAVALLSLAIKTDPKDCEAYALRAEVLCSQMKLTEATADCHTALQIEPGYKKAMIVMSEIKVQQKRNTP